VVESGQNPSRSFPFNVGGSAEHATTLSEKYNTRVATSDRYGWMHPGELVSYASDGANEGANAFAIAFFMLEIKFALISLLDER
jgi:hypothetical protein